MLLTLHNFGHTISVVIIGLLIHTILNLHAQVKELQWLYSCPKQNSHNRDNIVRTSHSFTKKSNSDDADKTTLTFDHFKSFDDSNLQGSKFYSSVWCPHRNKHFCRISNLCYQGNTNEFFIFEDENSVSNNIEVIDGTFMLDLSSISGHNVYQTEVLSIPSTYSDNIKIHWINSTTLIFKPFLPGNIMHVFHDDLIPLYHSLQYMKPHSGSASKVGIQIFSLEDLIDTEYEDLYNIFSKYKIVYKESFENKGLTCFQEAYVGLLTDTVWYNFGFTNPQGAIDDVTASGNQIRQTVKYIRNQLSVDSDHVRFSGGDYLVLLTRKENRKILNEGDLTFEIIKQLKMKVINMNFENYSINDMIETVTHSKGIIGMHGSLLILSIFLKPGSIVIELFPYAINPYNYTPYKTVAELSGMNIIYTHWVNENPQNTVGHPDWPEEVGGLGHLDPLQREIILNQTEVPPHLCCSDPSWLYHIYQDTKVDTEKITSLIKNAIEASGKLKLSAENSSQFYPSKVQHINCFLTNQYENSKITQNNKYFLHLSWRVPWTSYLLSDDDKVHYEVLIQDQDSESASVSSHVTSATEMSLNVDKLSSYQVWVKCVVNGTHGGQYSHAVSCDNEVK